jgi:glycosyltransferase involved in cell wall biosynthesis
VTLPLHIITCEYPPIIGGVSEHSRIIAQAAASEGYDVHVWTVAAGDESRNVHVRAGLGDLSAASLRNADAALNEWAPPRRLVVQWVPHGYGRKGLNVLFSRWIRRRALAGDRIDLIVHEPYMDFFGRSWLQPAAALVQRFMTRTVVRSAERVWLTIPGWQARIDGARQKTQTVPQMLPVPGTIPRVENAQAVEALRRRLLRGRSQLVGYFGSGGPYPLDGIAAAVAELARRKSDAAFVCIGRGSEVLADQVRLTGNDSHVPLLSTGTLSLNELSLHLQACDTLLQPYADGVSGRRTTTVSALEHGIPVATTIGPLSEPFWSQTQAVEAVPASAIDALPSAILRLLEPSRNATARACASALYRERFDPTLTLKPFFAAVGGAQER